MAVFKVVYHQLSDSRGDYDVFAMYNIDLDVWKGIVGEFLNVHVLYTF